MKLWNILCWIFFISIIITALPYIDSSHWIRWKWGYYNIDLIPTVLLLLILYIVNLEIRISKIERKIEGAIEKEIKALRTVKPSKLNAMDRVDVEVLK